MQYRIEGTVLQMLEVSLSQGEAIFTESGGMSWMTDGIEMSTNARGGLLSGLGRALAGESLFMTTYTAQSGQGKVVFTPEAPGKVVDVKLGAGQSLICQKDAFMCAENSAKLEIYFRRKLGTGLFGGEGFILQKVSGPGTVFFEYSGEVVSYQLASGERLKVDPGHIAMFEPTVQYEITMVRGITNIFFSGEGLFLATLTGPGKIWLQTHATGKPGSVHIPLHSFEEQLVWAVA